MHLLQALVVSFIHLKSSNAIDEKQYKILRSLKEDDSVVAVVRREMYQDMVYDRSLIGSHSIYDPPFQPAYPAFAIMQCALYLDREISRAIQIGLGAGDVPGFLRKNGIVTDVVDISEAVVELAAEFFSFDRCDVDAAEFSSYLSRFDIDSYGEDDEDDWTCQNGATVIADGIWVLEHPPSSPIHEVFIVDVYTGFNANQFFVKEVFEMIEANWLKPSGVLIVNFVGFLTGRHAVLPKSIYQTLRAVFNHVKAYKEWPDIKSSDASNIVFYASNDPISFHLPNTGHFKNPDPRTYFNVVVNFPNWEAFTDEPLEEVEVNANGDTSTPTRNPSKFSAHVLTRNNYNDPIFDETHHATEIFMQKLVHGLFHPSIWDALGVKKDSK